MKFPLIYAHRGMWHLKEEQNSKKSIEDCSPHGFGLETDFRSFNGNLIISHDPQKESDPLVVSELSFNNLPVAMNIKEDGLLDDYADFLRINKNEHSFLFDGSIPEMIKIKERGLPHALRLSEFERDLPWESNFVWVDAFISEWWIGDPLIINLMESKFLVFVSPEIHQREYINAWQYFKQIVHIGKANFGICTDFPITLQDYLNDN